MQHTPDASVASVKRTSVMLVDDHHMFQEGLRMLFEGREEFTVEASFDTATGALSYIEEHCPDVAVIDLVLPDGRGTDIIEACREKSEPCAIIALSVHSEASYIHGAFKAGADAYVNKASATGSLLEAIRAVRRGDLYADGVTTRSLVESMGWSVGTGIADPAYRSLSRRERQVFALIADGYGTKQIAHQLDVSPKTVETHRASIYQKLDLDSPVAVARFAAHIGII